MTVPPTPPRPPANSDPKTDAKIKPEAETGGERSDLGQTHDALNTALSGSNLGSDTRAGSLRGGSAGGSERDPDQALIDKTLSREGRTSSDTPPKPKSGEPVRNTGEDAHTQGDDADAATG